MDNPVFRNIANLDVLETIFEFIDGLIADKDFTSDQKDKVSGWFRRRHQGLRCYLQRNIKNRPEEFYEYSYQLTGLPEEAPAWLMFKYTENPNLFSEESFFWISDSPENKFDFVTKIAHIIDYFQYFFSEHPHKSLVNRTWAVILESIKQWEDIFVISESDQLMKGEDVILITESGHCWVEIKSKKALKNEGSRMRHCIGHYWPAVKKGRIRVFSLRDPKNHPIITAEFNTRSHEITQAVGKTNSRVHYKYAHQSIDLLNLLSGEHDNKKMDINRNFDECGIFFSAGKYYSAMDYLEIDGKLLPTESLSSEILLKNSALFPCVVAYIDDKEVARGMFDRNLDCFEYLDKLSTEDMLYALKGGVPDNKGWEYYPDLKKKYTDNHDIIAYILEELSKLGDLSYHLYIGETFHALPQNYRDDPKVWSLFLTLCPSSRKYILEGVSSKSLVKNFDVFAGFLTARNFYSAGSFRLSEVIDKGDFEDLYNHPEFRKNIKAPEYEDYMYLTSDLRKYLISRPGYRDEVLEIVKSNPKKALEYRLTEYEDLNQELVVILLGEIRINKELLLQFIRYKDRSSSWGLKGALAGHLMDHYDKDIHNQITSLMLSGDILIYKIKESGIFFYLDKYFDIDIIKSQVLGIKSLKELEFFSPSEEIMRYLLITKEILNHLSNITTREDLKNYFANIHLPHNCFLNPQLLKRIWGHSREVRRKTVGFLVEDFDSKLLDYIECMLEKSGCSSLRMEIYCKRIAENPETLFEHWGSVIGHTRSKDKNIFDYPEIKSAIKLILKGLPKDTYSIEQVVKVMVYLKDAPIGFIRPEDGVAISESMERHPNAWKYGNSASDRMEQLRYESLEYDLIYNDYKENETY